MRIFEFILVSFSVTTFLLALFPSKLRVARIFSISIWGAFLAHLIFEGAHWQMVGFYLVAAFVFFALRFFPQVLVHSWASPIFVGLNFIALMPLVLVPIFQLPKPSGKYGIGYDTPNSLVDVRRNDIFTNESGRSIVVQFYYPTDTKNGQDGRYVDKETSLSPLARLNHLPSFFFSHFKLVSLNASTRVPIAAGVGKLPLLIFSPGRGGFRNHNSVLVEELVSQGYIIACIDHPSTVAGVAVWNQMLHDDESQNINVALDARMEGTMSAAWGDEVTKYLAQDVSFLIDELKQQKIESDIHLSPSNQFDNYANHIDFDKIGMFGVSLGGMTSAQACSADSRIKSCLIVDAYMPPTVLKNGIKQPVMILTRPPSDMIAEKWPIDVVALHQNTMHKIYEKASKDAYFLTIKGAFHANFSDAWLYVNQPLGRWLRFLGPTDGAIIQDIVNQNTLAFFDKYLKGNRDEAIAQSQSDNNYTLIAK